MHQIARENLNCPSLFFWRHSHIQLGNNKKYPLDLPLFLLKWRKQIQPIQLQPTHIRRKMPISAYILKPSCAFIREAMRIRNIQKMIVDMHITFAVTIEDHRDFFKCSLDKFTLLRLKKMIWSPLWGAWHARNGISEISAESRFSLSSPE